MGRHADFWLSGRRHNGVFGALARANGKIEFVQARHEEMAVLMASAHAKFTGELGVCIATSGAGASHLITGLYDARMDHQPVLAIVGQQARTALGSHYQQELDLVSMFKDVAGAFVQQASAPSQVRHLLDRAVCSAVGERPPGQEVTPVGVAAGCDLFNGKAKNRSCGQRVVATPNPPWASNKSPFKPRAITR
ncbi:Thiamine pyrophosphate [Pseudomonas koreensis]|uniref:Thiamine pyrophosphate n=1 Tax=Pseudomonas koreensis TaxID=198620 RepID=A0AA94EIY9_9PSED|nr:Thiamine pyrophosphate [Pseudomonas koreensis]